MKIPPSARPLSTFYSSSSSSSLVNDNFLFLSSPFNTQLLTLLVQSLLEVGGQKKEKCDHEKEISTSPVDLPEHSTGTVVFY